jgi:hypothetical protein
LGFLRLSSDGPEDYSLIAPYGVDITRATSCRKQIADTIDHAFGDWWNGEQIKQGGAACPAPSASTGKAQTGA